MHMRTYF